MCTGAGEALLCVDGTYVAAPCKGPSGCKSAPFACDYSESEHGVACVEGETPAPMKCTANKKARVRCKSGKVDREECDGPQGCYPRTAISMGCDHAFKAGTSCSIDGDWCSDTGDEWLQCQGGKMVPVAVCRGPLKCKPFEGTIACDTSLGQANDPCVGAAKSCTSDRAAVLACVEGHLRVETTCTEGKRCDPAAVGCK